MPGKWASFLCLSSALSVVTQFFLSLPFVKCTVLFSSRVLLLYSAEWQIFFFFFWAAYSISSACERGKEQETIFSVVVDPLVDLETSTSQNYLHFVNLIKSLQFSSVHGLNKLWLQIRVRFFSKFSTVLFKLKW